MIYTLLLPLAAVAQAAAAVTAMAGMPGLLSAILALLGLAATAFAWWLRLPQELSLTEATLRGARLQAAARSVDGKTAAVPGGPGDTGVTSGDTRTSAAPKIDASRHQSADGSQRDIPRAPTHAPGESLAVGMLDAARTITETQFELVRGEFQQLRGILGDATHSLSSSFTGLGEASDGQRQQLRELVDELLATTSRGAQEEQSHGIHRFARQSDAIVSRLVDNLGDLSACGERAGGAFSGLLQRVEDILHHTREVDAINEQINLLATHTAIDSVRASEEGRRLARIAMDVRNLAERTRRFSTELRMVIEDARAHANDLGSEVQRLNGLDLGVAREARDEVRRMGEVMRDLNARASGQFEHINDISLQIREHVFSGVMSLQFEDLMRQLMGHVETRIGALELTSDELLALQRDTLAKLPDDGALDARLHEINHRSEARFAELNHKAVSQTAMDEGSAEMF